MKHDTINFSFLLHGNSQDVPSISGFLGDSGFALKEETKVSFDFTLSAIKLLFFCRIEAGFCLHVLFGLD